MNTAPSDEFTAYIRHYVDCSGIPYSAEDLKDWWAPLSEIETRTGSLPISQLVFEVVAHQQLRKPQPWQWIAIELLFESIVAELLSRQKAGLSFLERVGATVKDPEWNTYLDIHNDRYERFKDYLCICGHPCLDQRGEFIRIKRE